MNTFLTEYEHGGKIDKKVNFALTQNANHSSRRFEEDFKSPYIEFYLQNMDDMDLKLKRKLN